MGEVAVRPPAAPLSSEQLKFIAHTDFVPKAMRGNVPAIMACVATGRAIGLDDMHALRAINIIDGKATMSAELMVTLARRAGHSIQHERGDGWCKAIGKRVDNGDTDEVTWTRDMAQKAGLTGKDNWKKHEATMLQWRADSQLCRFLFPDVLVGVSYTPEEAELSPEERVDEALETAIPVDTEQPDDTMPALESGSDVAAAAPPAAGAPADTDPVGGVVMDTSEPDLSEGEQTSFAELIPKKARGK